MSARRSRGRLSLVQIAITGSIATDHLMTFKGRFARLPRRRAARQGLAVASSRTTSRSAAAGWPRNIAFGMANLGQRPILVGAVGEDFADYRSWLERHGVDCDSVHVSESKHTARFVCTTDEDMAQIATFYAGAMSEARAIELGPIAQRVGGLDLVLVGANDPEAMLRHTHECRTRGIPFAADPSQQLAFADGDTSSASSSTAPTSCSPTSTRPRSPSRRPAGAPTEIADRVHTRVITTRQGRRRRSSARARSPSRCRSPARCAGPTRPASATRSAPASSPASPPTSGCGTAAELGSMLATYVIETVGTQEYTLGKAQLPRSGSPTPTARSPRTRSSRTSPASAPTARPVHRDGDRPPVEPLPTTLGVRPQRGATTARTWSPSVATCEPGTLLEAYRSGLFPMGLGELGARPLGWWSPDPRGVLLPGGRARQPLAAASRCGTSRCASTPPSARWSRRCADPSREGRWITDEIADAYTELHALGWAHSIETWQDGELVGGLYGARRRRACSRGSRCSTACTDASKAAVVATRRLRLRRRRPAPAHRRAVGHRPPAQPRGRHEWPRERLPRAARPRRCQRRPSAPSCPA